MVELLIMTPTNLKGKVFGRLKVISYDENSRGSGHARWFCTCSCNPSRKISIRASHLKDGSTKSCGCFSIEAGRKFLLFYSNSRKHKGAGNPRWKGDGAKHSSIHTWLNRHYRKKKCEECGTTDKLEFALKSGMEHGHDRKRYRVLCRSDHMKYDYKSGIRK